MANGLRPFALPRPDAARLACADLHRMGDRQSVDPPSPSLRLSNNTPSVKTSPIWGRKKSLMWGMCSGSPRCHNLINRQAGYPQRLPPSQSRPVFLLPLAVILGRLVRGCAELRLYGVLVRSSLSFIALLPCVQTLRWRRVGEGEQKACDG
jgi:hypothetical protein